MIVVVALSFVVGGVCVLAAVGISQMSENNRLIEEQGRMIQAMASNMEALRSQLLWARSSDE